VFSVAEPPFSSDFSPRASMGIPGLDNILGGGLTRDRVYLIEGNPGTGKTTLSLQFLLEGVRRGEPGLYITLSETAEELRDVAATHNWSLDDLSLYELVNELGMDPDGEQSVLHPSEVELGETTREIMQRVEELKPRRVIFDSLSELRLLAQSPLRYRRQILALKHFFASRDCTVLLLDDRTSENHDLHLHSIAHGVITLEQVPRAFGSERRRLRVIKMRGIKFRGGYHDLTLDTGGITVYPQLVASEHRKGFELRFSSTGNDRLDALLGGGLMPGTNTLLMGPSGVGKTTTAMSCVLAALERGERATYYLFDEGIGTLMARSTALGLDVRRYLENGQLKLAQIDPAALSPGEFSSLIRVAVEEHGATTLVIDSLNAYMQSMPGEQFLLLQLHEVLSYLGQQGVKSLLVLGQHGIVGEIRSDIDLSYLSDSILLFRFFEAQGAIRSAISVLKSRSSAHERSIRELQLTEKGPKVGDPLTDFEGVMSGVPTYRGRLDMLPGPVRNPA
jgi:circadian clock protein KaiC